MHAEFQQLNTQVWGVSVDLAPTQGAFARHCGLSYKLVSGFPRHEAARTLGVFDEERGITRRVTFVVDSSGVLRHVIDDPGDMERHAREALEAVQGLAAP